MVSAQLSLYFCGSQAAAHSRRLGLVLWLVRLLCVVYIAEVDWYAVRDIILRASCAPTSCGHSAARSSHSGRYDASWPPRRDPLRRPLLCTASVKAAILSGVFCAGPRIAARVSRNCCCYCAQSGAEAAGKRTPVAAYRLARDGLYGGNAASVASAVAMGWLCARVCVPPSLAQSVLVR